MARVRNLKPGFFTNEDLAECTPWARLCFAGLWTLADREGRLEDRPKRIKGQLFPMDTVDVEPLLDELERHHFIMRYTDNDRGFIQVIEFSKHQNPHHREPSSSIPSPESLGLLRYNNASKAQGKPEAQDECDDKKAPEKPEALRPSSVIPSPSGRAEPGTQNKEQGQNPLARQAERMFAERFWPAYPRKVGREAARKSFVKLRPDEPLLSAMLAALAKQSASEQWRRDGGQFVPHPATWINGKRWLDEVDDGRRPTNDDTPDYLVGAI